MGKTRKKHARNTWDTADGGEAKGYSKKINEGEEEETESKEELLQNIIRQLQDSCPESQECGLQSFALLVAALGDSGRGAPFDLDSVLEHKLVRLVGPLMADANSPDTVVHSATGALKNLSLVSAEACDEMVKQDVMTPLCALLLRFGAEEWTPAKKKGGKKRNIADPKADIFVEAVNLLWNLCEANANALAIFNTDCLADLLIRHLDKDKFDTSIRLSVMQCLYTASEDNPEVHTKIQASSAVFESILADSSDGDAPDHLYLQVLSVGVVLNAAGSASEDLPEATWRIIISLVAKILAVDQRKMACDYTSAIPLTASNGVAKEEEEEDEEETMDAAQESAKKEEEKKEKKLDVLRQELNLSLLAQQTALEILANILCRGDDSDGEGWENEEESDGAMSDDAASESGSGGGGASNGYTDSSSILRSLPTCIVESLQSETVVEKVLAKANMPPENVCEVLKKNARREGKMLMKMLNTLRSRSFLCLNNLVSSLSVEDLGGAETLFQTWTGLGKLCLESSHGATDGVSTIDLQESASSAMRAIVQKLAETKSSFAQFASMTKDDLTQVLEFGAASQDSAVRVNVVNMAGDIGAVVILTEAGAGAAEVAALFLLEAAARDSSLRVVAEALDKTFDLFSEDSTDPLCKKLGVAGRLRGMLPGLKAKMGMKKRELGAEDYSVVVMAKNNLVRFLKYKEKRGLK